MSVNGDAPAVRLELDSRPETLTLVRGVLAGVAELIGLDPELLDDLKTAVSEACNNVVMHAYEGETGPLTVLHVHRARGDRGGGGGRGVGPAAAGAGR